MPTPKKSKTIHYRQVNFINAEHNLQLLLQEALGEGGVAEKAKIRKEILNEDDQLCRLINKHKVANGMLFCQLICYEAGRSQPLVTEDDDADSYSIDAITTESIQQDNGEDSETLQRRRREFVDSILYFGVMGNHMIVMQSQALTCRELETHLSWLLGTCTAQLEPTASIALSNKPPEETIQKLNRIPIKQVDIGAPVEFRQEPSQSRETMEWVPAADGSNILKTLLPNLIQDLQLRETLDDANLMVKLQITYMSRTTRQGQKALDNIAHAFRHSHPEDVRIHLKGGGTLEGDDLKLSKKVQISTLRSGLLDESDLFQRMHSWLVSLFQSEEIEEPEE